MKKYLLIIITLISISTYGQDEKAKLDWANLEKYKTENTKLQQIPKNEKRIIFMGNSITEAWQYVDSMFFKNKLFVNRGISGQTTPQMLLRFRQDVIQLKPSVVVILAGINDIAQNTGPITIEGIFGNIQSMVQLAQANNIKVVLSSVIPANVIPWKKEIEPAEIVVQLNSMIEAYCKKNKITYVDYYSKLVDDKKGLNKEYSEDGVHPNIKGYKIMDSILENAISKTLKIK